MVGWVAPDNSEVLLSDQRTRLLLLWRRSCQLRLLQRTDSRCERKKSTSLRIDTSGMQPRRVHTSPAANSRRSHRHVQWESGRARAVTARSYRRPESGAFVGMRRCNGRPDGGPGRKTSRCRNLVRSWEAVWKSERRKVRGVGSKGVQE